MLTMCGTYVPHCASEESSWIASTKCFAFHGYDLDFAYTMFSSPQAHPVFRIETREHAAHHHSDAS